MKALGLIETKGLLAAVEGADAMLKTADVRLLEKNLVGGGLVTITIAGEVSAVRASVDAAVSAIGRIHGATLVSEHVIARPDEELARILSFAELTVEEPQAPAASSAPAAPATPAVAEEPAGGNAQIYSDNAGSTANPDPAAVSPAIARALTEEEAEAEGAPMPAHPSARPEATASVKPPKSETVRHEVSQLKKMSVNRLRQIAASLSGLALSAEEVRKAVKKDLIEAIISAYRQIEE
jgi:microcompartment protein CcmL/EutN